MLDDFANTAPTSDTQRRKGEEWTPDEKKRLREIATRSLRKHQLRELFPGRTLATIKVKLYQTRRELGVPKRGMTSNLRPALVAGPPMLDPNDEGIYAPDWQEARRPALELASQNYLQALQQLAA
jgi:hypothetical protein